MQKIIPAILTSDPEELRAKLALFKGHSDWMHVDIMDGKFVPNASASMFELNNAFQHFNLELHLMVQDPAAYFGDCDEIGAKRVFFHLEAVSNLEDVLDKAGKYKFEVGVALNPETSVAFAKPFLSYLEEILVMGVHPGFQGQPFIESTVEKVTQLRALHDDVLLGVDGGVDRTNIAKLFSAGANSVVVGSKIMRAEDPIKAFKEFLEMIE